MQGLLRSSEEGICSVPVTSVTSEALPRRFRSERAICARGSTDWVIIDEDYVFHREAVGYLESLRALDRSVNTQRTYAGRIALYLSYCSVAGVDWAGPALWQLRDFLWWLTEVPLAAKGSGPSAPRFRSRGTANAVLTTVCEFLRFGAAVGWTPPAVAASLSEPRVLGHLPHGFDAGEHGQFREVRSRRLKFAVAVEGYEWLTADQVDRLVAVTSHARDRFLVMLLACTGMRVGEALGLHREDLHLLSSSTSLGCAVAGPHVHIRRRENPNGALAKSRFSRSIPVEEPLVDVYADYLHERGAVPEADVCDMVFVNLFRAPLGRAMRYAVAKEMFDRLAARAGFVARPHMLRHGAATRWVRAGVNRDVVQQLLGHASASSMEPYLHASDEIKREAVERVAAGRQVLA